MHALDYLAFDADNHYLADLAGSDAETQRRILRDNARELTGSTG